MRKWKNPILILAALVLTGLYVNEIFKQQAFTCPPGQAKVADRSDRFGLGLACVEIAK